ncbi:MAG: hypothetical protein KY476_23855 [Planctomycetes bacterium]|nr:hypothetical protein [Planctomycetota bacterium]
MVDAEWGGLTPEAAKAILAIRFSDADLERARDLALRNQDGELTEQEELEMHSYRKAANLLAILHAKARLALRDS